MRKNGEESLFLASNQKEYCKGLDFREHIFTAPSPYIRISLLEAPEREKYPSSCLISRSRKYVNERVLWEYILNNKPRP
jgi:hypothetical protein